MRNIILQIIVGIIISSFISSCSIGKRRYMAGFYVQKSKKQQHLAKVKTQPDDTKLIQSYPNKGELISSNELKMQVEKSDLPLINLFQNENCDVLILKNAEEINVKVIEITDNEIKYRNCNDIDGAIITIKKAEVFMIKYSNGIKEVIKAPQETNKSDIYETVPQDNSEIKKNEINAKDSKKKTSVISLLSFILAVVNIPVFAFCLSSYAYGIFILPVLIGLIAIILSAIGSSKIRKNPDKYKGKVFSVLGFIFGLIFLILSFILFVLFFLL